MDNTEMANPVFREIVSAIRHFAITAKDLADLQEFSSDVIAKRLPNYKWWGSICWIPTMNNVLVLGSFRGASTLHVRIPVTEGICGAAIAQGETVIVDDVSKDPKYLACSMETKSEIVVPIRSDGRIVGEIDIDSYTLNCFGPEDRGFLEECVAVVGHFLEGQST